MKLFFVVLLCFVSLGLFAQKRPYYGGGKHTTSHGGYYQGGSGSSHKGGHYKNYSTGNHYGIHKRRY